MKPVRPLADTFCMVKIVLLGDSGVGKTNLLLRFVNDRFQINCPSTIGVDFKCKLVNVNGRTLKMHLWDTAGQEKFKHINPTYYRNSIAVILTYSIIDLASFEAVTEWMKKVHQHCDSDVILCLIGNKVDLKSQRKVEMDDGTRLAQRYNMLFKEVSAKDGSNIQAIFEELACKIAQKVGPDSTGKQNGFELGKDGQVNVKNTGEQRSNCSC